MLAGMRQVVRSHPLAVGGGALLYLGSMYLAAVYLNATQKGDQDSSGDVLVDPCCTQGLAPLPKGIRLKSQGKSLARQSAARNFTIDDLSQDLPDGGATKQVSAGGRTHRTFSDIARLYDGMVSTEELISFVSFLRSSLVPIAKGRVLEVSAGTGRTVEEYRFDKRIPMPGEFRREGVRKLTMLDASGEMLAQAAGKLSTRSGSSREESDASIAQAEAAAGRAREGTPAVIWKCEVSEVPVELIVGDACRLPFSDGSFDTVVDSFGLCSVDDPVLALNEIARVCKPGGQVLLIEHGRSEWDWLNAALDSSAQGHRKQRGCWYNRDITECLRRSNLELQDHSRWNFWTTHVVRARPRALPVGSALAGDGARAATGDDKVSRSRRR